MSRRHHFYDGADPLQKALSFREALNHLAENPANRAVVTFDYPDRQLPGARGDEPGWSPCAILFERSAPEALETARAMRGARQGDRVEMLELGGDAQGIIAAILIGEDGVENARRASVGRDGTYQGPGSGPPGSPPGGPGSD